MLRKMETKERTSIASMNPVSLSLRVFRDFFPKIELAIAGSRIDEPDLLSIFAFCYFIDFLRPVFGEKVSVYYLAVFWANTLA